MSLSIVYKKSFIYSSVIKLLYGKNYRARFLEVASEIKDEKCTVLDVCCGDCALYDVGLKTYKNVSYAGIEINENFIKDAQKKGLSVSRIDIMKDQIPSADYVVLQGSFYQFYPDLEIVVTKLLQAAKIKLIISEPIVNLSSSSWSFVSKISKHSANPGDGHKEFRFDENSFKGFFKSKFPDLNITYKIIPGGRDIVAVILKDQKS